MGQTALHLCENREEQSVRVARVVVCIPAEEMLMGQFHYVSIPSNPCTENVSTLSRTCYVCCPLILNPNLAVKEAEVLTQERVMVSEAIMTTLG